MNITKLFVLLTVMLLSFNGVTQVSINEIMSSNDTILQDQEGDYSDWIELYNYSDQDVNLLNYKLSDDSSNYGKWSFSDIIIPSHGFLIVFASEKNVISSEIHTNFKIKQNGEALFLSNSGGELISEIPSISLPDNYSYLSINDGGIDREISSSPSPGASNSNSSAVFCSQNSGLYTTPQIINLDKSNADEVIYYTLNGKIPTVNDYVYSDYIELNNNSNRVNHYSEIPTTPTTGDFPLETYIWKEPNNVYKTNVLRYASFLGDEQKSKTYTKTFFIDHEIHNKYTFPIVSLVSDEENIFDYEKGIYVPGERFDTSPQTWIPQGNYFNRGAEWERDLHVSYFGLNGDLGFETDARMRMRGAGSVQYSQKSFSMYCRSEVGINTVDFPLFSDQTNTKFKRLVFRNSGSDFSQTHFRDAFLQDLLRDFDIERQAYQPVISFLNGEYWGIYHIREKYDDFYFKNKFGVDRDSINISGPCYGASHGDGSDYDTLLDFAFENSLAASSEYEYVKSIIDISSYMDMFIAEIYFANQDWPCNNFGMWKPPGNGSKWRCMIMDLDVTASFVADCSFDTPSLSQAMSQINHLQFCPCSNIIFVKLMNNLEFRNDFIERFNFHLSNTFSKENVLNKLEEYKEIYSFEIQEHIDRYKYPESYEAWEEQIEKMEVFFSERPCFMKNHINEYFSLHEQNITCFEDDYSLEFSLDIYPNPSSNGAVSVNGSRYEWIDYYTITNIQGKKVMEGEIDNHQFNLNLSDLKPGVYIIHVANKEQVASGKIILTD